MNKPPPSMARWLGSPVGVMDPVLKSRWVPATLTPRPICTGFEPPVDCPGGVPSLNVRENWVLKSIRLDLNAVVLTLAMLLPMTLSFCEWA